MKNQLITLFLIVSVCRGQTHGSPVKGDIIIDGTTHSIPDVTDVPVGNKTTPAPTTSTTSATTTTTLKPTTTTHVTTTTTLSTTVSPTTTTPIPITTTPQTTTSSTSKTTASSSTAPTKVTTVTPTKQPVTTPAPSPANNRKFDGPSFVGGIVLASGLMAIGFVAFKFYKARTELNYHTL